MLSVIMPYWDRQAAADRALSLFAQVYPDLDAEIIVVDDGNKVPFVVPDVDLNIRVLRLPEKDKPTPQSTTWNAGVREAHGNVIALNCIEILHHTAVLPHMLDELDRLGLKGYVLAAAWCPEHRMWHCHNSVRVPDCPRGAGIGFCGVMHKSLFLEAGGFDESYMDGAGYEDRDFIRRLVAVGAQFLIRDDLVVTHPKTGASIRWSPEGLLRNEALFRRTWPC